VSKLAVVAEGSRMRAWVRLTPLVGANQMEAVLWSRGRWSFTGGEDLRRGGRHNGETANQRGEEKKEGSRRERESPGSRWWCR
jgi:hypothetical protein